MNKSEDDVELERGREKRRIVEKVGTSFFQKNKKYTRGADQTSRSDEQRRTRIGEIITGKTLIADCLPYSSKIEIDPSSRLDEDEENAEDKDDEVPVHTFVIDMF